MGHGDEAEGLEWEECVKVEKMSASIEIIR